MSLCYLALGSNLGTPERQLRCAINSLRKHSHIRVIKCATFYHNEAWGRKMQPPFCNTVVAIQTRLTPEQLLIACQSLEKKQGRCRIVKWGARTLDIDILLYDSRKLHTPRLTIPHPLMLYRDFVLIPLQEIAPEVLGFLSKK